jgi:hypothetical protein
MDALKAQLIAVLREQHDETSWTGIRRGVSEARTGSAVMVALPPPLAPTLSAIYEAYESKPRRWLP